MSVDARALLNWQDEDQETPRAYLIAVNGEFHSTEDPWVIERATDEADNSQIPLPPYRGTAIGLHDYPIHLYCESEAVAERARDWYAAQKEARDAVRT